MPPTRDIVIRLVGDDVSLGSTFRKAGQDIDGLAKDSTQAFNRISAQFERGEISAKEYAAGIEQISGRVERALSDPFANLSDEVRETP